MLFSVQCHVVCFVLLSSPVVTCSWAGLHLYDELSRGGSLYGSSMLPLDFSEIGAEFIQVKVNHK